MSKYDLVSIVRPTAEDSLVEEIHKNITEIITNNGGSVSEQGVWQKRKLAYQIENFNEGIYSITTFDAPPTVPSELDRVLKIHLDRKNYQKITYPVFIQTSSLTSFLESKNYTWNLKEALSELSYAIVSN